MYASISCRSGAVRLGTVQSVGQLCFKRVDLNHGNLNAKQEMLTLPERI